MTLVTSQGLRVMSETDLELVLAWRNHPEIRRFMYTQHEITLAEHASWFARASCDARRHLMIFELEGNPLGFISFHELGDGKVADWGFYVAPDAPKGSGRLLGRSALNYAFADAALHKVCGQAIEYNVRSVGFHASLGFHQEGILRQQHYDGQQYHDVICFGLLSSEWQSAQ